MMHIAMGRIGEIKFASLSDGEFTEQLVADIPGIKPEDVRFEQIGCTPGDDIVHLKISCSTKLSENETVSFFGTLKIDLREFYGFDYWVCDGMLTLKLYKTKKKNIHHLGFGFQFILNAGEICSHSSQRYRHILQIFSVCSITQSIRNDPYHGADRAYTRTAQEVAVLA